MFNLFKNRYLPSMLIAGITLFTATACSTTKLVKDENGINIERIDSNAADIGHVYVTQVDDTLSLRGELKKRLSKRGPIPGHLHVTLINSQGEMLKEADINYTRRNVKSSKAFFSTKLPIDLPSGSTIRITHFERKTHQPIPDQPNWKDAQH